MFPTSSTSTPPLLNNSRPCLVVVKPTQRRVLRGIHTSGRMNSYRRRFLHEPHTSRSSTRLWRSRSKKREFGHELNAQGDDSCDAWSTGNGGLRKSPSVSRIFLNGKDHRGEGW